MQSLTIKQLTEALAKRGNNQTDTAGFLQNAVGLLKIELYEYNGATLCAALIIDLLKRCVELNIDIEYELVTAFNHESLRKGSPVYLDQLPHPNAKFKVGQCVTGGKLGTQTAIVGRAVTHNKGKDVYVVYSLYNKLGMQVGLSTEDELEAVAHPSEPAVDPVEPTNVDVDHVEELPGSTDVKEPEPTAWNEDCVHYDHDPSVTPVDCRIYPRENRCRSCEDYLDD